MMRDPVLFLAQAQERDGKIMDDNMIMIQIRELQGENAKLRGELLKATTDLNKAAGQLAAASKNMEEFKDKVGRKAMTLARENRWCNDVQYALRELDIPIPDMSETIELTVRFELTGTPQVDINSISNDYLASCVFHAEINLDDEWEDVEQIDYTVESARIISKSETR